MASQTAICNQALTKLGAQRIINLTDEGKSALVMRTIYDIKRDAELAAHPWTFAIAREQLPASSTAPAWGWQYAYPLPADYLALVEVDSCWVFGATDELPFQIESFGSGTAILTNIGSPLRIRYIKRITNAGMYPPLFVEALACRLAAEACEDLTQSLSKREAAWNERTQAVRDAKRVNSIEQPPRHLPDTSWSVAARPGV